MTGADRVDELLSVYLEAGDHPPAPETLCRDCPELLSELRRRIEAVQAIHRLGVGPAGPSEPELTADHSPGDRSAGAEDRLPRQRIGPYKLLQRIGQGGMGEVYMAEQVHPVRRRVALKLIKAGMDSAQVVARFEAERQALALMDHPNIARVLDADTTESGTPYFVMELVHGVPITKYCDDARLTPRERLELFVPVCQAIQHAHQKGIIHRDIKPSNILVTLYDGKPAPKVIDFGVAKAIEQPLTDRTMFTQYGATVGTFEYMAPEQAEMSALGVDTRADVYSLGVLAYELLTGTTPLGDRLRQAGFSEMLRMIREEEPPRPSSRLSTADRLPTVAAARRTEPTRLPWLVRGELDWIVMKCLEKDRTRRYGTAEALARDVERYLADEPVEACPPSVLYRVRKFTRKHATWLTVATVFAGLLVAGAVVSALLAVRAREAEGAAVASEERAVAARDELRVALTRQMAVRLEADMRRFARVGDALAATVDRRDDWDERHLNDWMGEMLGREPEAYGLCLAYEPRPDDRIRPSHRHPAAGLVPLGAHVFLPDRDGYSLYKFRGGEKGAVVTEPLRPHYRYRTQHWYATALKTKEVRWAEPFMDTSAGERPMVS